MIFNSLTEHLIRQVVSWYCDRFILKDCQGCMFYDGEMTCCIAGIKEVYQTYEKRKVMLR